LFDSSQDHFLSHYLELLTHNERQKADVAENFVKDTNEQINSSESALNYVRGKGNAVFISSIDYLITFET
jgi:hypothetical protein